MSDLIVYLVLDTHRNEWARYMSKQMAEGVRERCDADPALKDRAPFMIAAVTL